MCFSVTSPAQNAPFGHVEVASPAQNALLREGDTYRVRLYVSRRCRMRFSVRVRPQSALFREMPIQTAVFREAARRLRR